MRTFEKRIWAFTLTLLYLGNHCAYSLQNQTDIHDPSSIVKDGHTYWIFGTGDGIYACNSNDLIKWSSAKTPFTKSVYPSWINNYVPQFAGNFWAPQCFYMNGKYYLYYACSTWGVNTSCIGLATSPSLNNPVWTDEGVVVYSNTSKSFNAIDPALFRDTSGRVWMTYGSWFSGIKMQAIDSVTGKPADSIIYNVASFNDPENSHVVYNENYYYLFVNRGLCCKGTKSTYYIQVGRSSVPTGPYTGWRNVFSSSGNYIGPGALGYYKDNGIDWVTFHYYDGDNSGTPTLGIGHFLWQNGWPVITLNWLDSGYYKISDLNNRVWSNLNCSNDSGISVIAKEWQNYTCQVWHVNSLGNGNYSLNSCLGNPITIKNCQTPGAILSLSTELDNICSIFHIEKNSSGNFVLSVGQNNLVVQSASSFDSLLSTGMYFADDIQKWKFTKVSIDSVLAGIKPDKTGENFYIAPNPASDGEINIYNKTGLMSFANLTVLNLQGLVLKNCILNFQKSIVVKLNSKPGIYLISIQTDKSNFIDKVIVN